MRKTFFSLILALLVWINISGCASLIIGATAGGLGAFAISKDTIQGETDKPYEGLWNAALTVSRIRGTIKQEDRLRGYVELEAEKSRVWIRLIRLTRATTKLKIRARKYNLPNLNLAQDIFVKIMEEAK